MSRDEEDGPEPLDHEEKSMLESKNRKLLKLPVHDEKLWILWNKRDIRTENS